MNEKIREITIKSKLEKLNSMNSMTNKTHNTIDVSFSIPDWKQQ